MKVILHTTNKRKWGFETLATITDDSGKIWEESILHPEKAPPEEIMELAESKITDYLAMPKDVEPVSEKEVLESEIAVLQSAKQKLVSDIAVLTVEKEVLEPIKEVVK